MAQRRPIVAGNWKMNTTVSEATALAAALVENIGAIDEAEAIICPPSISLTAVQAALSGSTLAVGAQNLNAAERGAYTGEISWSMLVGICTHSIIGHSERRAFYHETDDEVNAKVRAALAAGLTPLACVGESLDQRDSGETETFVGSQVAAIFKGLSAEEAQRVVIAYEPIWAIGTGRPATAAIAQEVALQIRAVIRELYDAEVAEAVRIQYGGSVTGANAAEFAAEPDIDGALVGGASLKAADFAAIVRAFAARQGVQPALATA